MSMTLKIGKQTFSVANIQAASALYCKLRDAAGEGSRTWPNGTVTGWSGSYYISYNGKVWRGRARDWKEGDVPQFNPYEQTEVQS